MTNWADIEKPIPAHEFERLRALDSYKILDTLPEDDFDAITHLASTLCGTPIALISLLDSERQWFKSKVGLDVSETPRELAFCQFAIMGDEVMEVKDAGTEAPFSTNPLVTGDPGIRFYAGAPLILSEGINLGTLCVIDTKPHALSDDQKKALETLAREVVSHLELRKQRDLLAQSNRRLREFARVAAHDLKAPLRAIERLALMMGEDVKAKDYGNLDEYYELLVSRTGRMDRLIQGLLDYSLVDRPGDCAETLDLLQETRQAVQGLAVPDSFTVEISESLPKLRINQIRFCQIIQNLVSNAIKHHHREAGRIRIACEDQHPYYVFSVSDDGPGIAEKYHERIFQVFQTLQPRDTVDNTGIGLSIVKRIVEEEDGAMWVESQEGEGTTFLFSLHKTD